MHLLTSTGKPIAATKSISSLTTAGTCSGVLPEPSEAIASGWIGGGGIAAGGGIAGGGRIAGGGIAINNLHSYIEHMTIFILTIPSVLLCLCCEAF